MVLGLHSYLDKQRFEYIFFLHGSETFVSITAQWEQDKGFLWDQKTKFPGWL